MKRRWIVAGVVALAAAVAAFYLMFGGGDSTPSQKVSVPDTVHPEVYGCTSIVLAKNGKTYSEPGCYYIARGVTVTLRSECLSAPDFVEGGIVRRIIACETEIDPACTTVEEFDDAGKYIPQALPEGGFYVTVSDKKGCYYTPAYVVEVRVDGQPSARLCASGAAPQGFTRWGPC